MFLLLGCLCSCPPGPATHMAPPMGFLGVVGVACVGVSVLASSVCFFRGAARLAAFGLGTHGTAQGDSPWPQQAEEHTSSGTPGGTEAVGAPTAWFNVMLASWQLKGRGWQCRWLGAARRERHHAAADVKCSGVR